MILYEAIMHDAFRRAAPAVVGEPAHDPWSPMPVLTAAELEQYGLVSPTRKPGTAKDRLLGGLPRYAILAIFVKSAVFGYTSPQVQHMVDRNRAMDEAKAAELVFA